MDAASSRSDVTSPINIFSLDSLGGGRVTHENMVAEALDPVHGCLGRDDDSLEGAGPAARHRPLHLHGRTFPS